MPATEILPATIGALLTKENVRLGVEASDKEGLIRTLVRSLPATDPELDLEEVAQAVLDRERLLSTGVGYGVALPHAKTAALNSTQILFATTASPVEFDAFDGEPVQLVFLMVGPTRSSAQHIQILGRVSRIFNDEATRTRLLEADSEEEILDIFQSAEDKLISP